MAVYVQKTSALQRIAGDGQNAKVMTGATDKNNGTFGSVPAPLAGQNNSFLKGDGTWSDVDVTVDKITTSDIDKLF